MPDTDYPDRFLNAAGNGMNLIDRALANKLHDYVPLETLSALIADGSKQQPQGEIRKELHHACYVGQLKARLIPGSPGVPLQFGSTGGGLGNTYTNLVGERPDDYIIHRDDARRYFQWLDAMPEPGTPLWCWLRGKRADEAKKLREDQQDKADFQQLAKDRWKVSPKMLIAGPDGIVQAVGAAYVKKYTFKTVQGWANEIAPEGTRRPRGRPKKASADAEK